MSEEIRDDVLEPEAPSHKPTDDEIGDGLIEQFDGNVRWFYGLWHRYKDGYWQPDSQFQLAIWEHLKMLKARGIRPSAHKVSGVEKYLQAYLTVDDDLIDQVGDFINLQNGLFNLNSHELEPHRRDTFMTSQLPFAYDPDAHCHTFMRFLREALTQPNSHEPDGDLMRLVMEAIGYSLTSNTDYRASFWLVGASGTGKSVLINVLQALAGNSHVTIDLDQLASNSYQIADIAGKRVVSFTEPRANSVLADNHYKKLVSQDTITARQIFGKPFRFTPICKVWGAMNETPRVIDRSDAVFNRVYIVPMNNVVPQAKRDPDLTRKLHSELSGIFNFALTSLKRLNRAGKFTRVEQVENAREEYKAENDIEAAFVEQWCIRDETAQISGQQLYDAYNAWCKRNGSMPKSSVKVARDWTRLGFQRKRSNGTYYVGIRLNEIGGQYVQF